MTRIRCGGRIVLLTVVGTVAVGAGVAFAVSDSDFTSSSFNDCSYWGTASYDTNSSNYASWSSGDLNCSSRIYLTSYYWYAGIWNFEVSGWLAQHYVEKPSLASGQGPTTNVYGYHQIQKPLGTYSPSIETHAN